MSKTDTENNLKGSVDYHSTSRFVLGLVSGAIILFPTIFSSITAPFIWDWALYGFWLSAFIAFIGLSISFHISSLSNDNTPVRSSGIGNIFALISILCLFLFISANIISDRLSPPKIVSLTGNTYSAAPGEVVSFIGEARDNDGDRLVWSWTVEWEEKPLTGSENSLREKKMELQSTMRTAQWFIPKNIDGKSFKVTAKASDGDKTSEPQTIRVKVLDATK